MKRVDVWELVIAISRQAPKEMSAYTIAKELDRLARIGRTLCRMAEQACNEPTDAAFERRQARLERRASELGSELGIVVTTHRDPRGYVVRVETRDGHVIGGF